MPVRRPEAGVQRVPPIRRGEKEMREWRKALALLAGEVGEKRCRGAALEY